MPTILTQDVDFLRALKKVRRRVMDLKRRATMATPPTTSVNRGQGAISATVSAGGSGYVVGELLTLTGGTNAYPAILRVSSVSGGAVTGVTVSSPGCYSANPSNPVSVGSTTGSGTGATFTLSFSGVVTLGSFASAQVYSAGTDAALMSRNVVEPLTNISSSGYVGSALNLGEEARFSFWVDADKVDITFLDFTTKFQIYVDRERVRRLEFASVGASGADLLTAVFADARPRLIELRGSNLALRNIRVPSGYSIWKPSELTRPFGYMIGDSYTFGTISGTTTDEITSRFTGLLADALEMDIVALGVGGTSWTSTGNVLPVTRVTADLLARTTPPDFVFFALGYNNGLSAPDTATITTNMTDALNASIAGAPNARHFVIGPWTPLGSTANLTTVKTTMQAVVSALQAAGKDVVYIDIENIVNATNAVLYTGADNTHPTEIGHEYLAGRVALLVQPYL